VGEVSEMSMVGVGTNTKVKPPTRMGVPCGTSMRWRRSAVVPTTVPLVETSSTDSVFPI